MPKISSLRTDPDREARGVWTEFGGIRLLVARANTPAYFETARALLEPMLRQARDGKLSAAEEEDVVKQAMARHCLLGWRDLQDEDGGDVPYSEAQALAWFRDPTLHDLYENVRRTAFDRARYLAELAKDAEGN